MTPDVFFLFKKRLNAIQYNLLEITSIYDDIISKNEIYDMSSSELLEISKIKEKYEREIEDINALIKGANEKMVSCCQHEFVKDTIDISCDKSQNITFCSICEFTLK
jgi:hypothetical protein